MTQATLDHIDATLDDRLARLFDFIRIPSVSTDPAHATDVARAAQWPADTLRDMGATARVHATEGHPMVTGHLPGPQGAPHVLFFGHYDVQPPDPLELWKTPPFEPTLVEAGDEKHITGRGGSDDKGALPLRVSFLFEGEEESGSPSLPAFLEKSAKDLACDVILVCDTDLWDCDTPAVTMIFRGLVGQEITIKAADRDLHSGMFGNAAANALALMADVLTALRTPDGGVALPGFYDGIVPPPETWGDLEFDEAGFLANVGLSAPAGERGQSILAQVWARPSCDVHGIWGGYMSPGFKTVIPCEAHAKVSFRLVAGQDPVRVRDSFQAFVRARLPVDCSASFSDHGLSPAWSMEAGNPYLAPTLGAEWGRSTTCATGGSIPIIGALKANLGVDALLVGFARFDNRIHSPNEKYDLSSFHKGMRSWSRILEGLST